MPISDFDLKRELDLDPVGLGYAACGGSDQAKADRLNAQNGPGAGTVTVTWVDYYPHAGKFLAATPVVAALPEPKQTSYYMILQQLMANGGFNPADPYVAGALAGAVADGVLDQATVDGWKTRTGSRAEVLGGAGTVVTASDVSRCYGRV